MAVVNEGISGNRLWHDALAARSIFGPSGLSRFDRDALGIIGASHIVVMLGINDICRWPGGDRTVSPDEQVGADEIIAGLKQLALRAHAHGIRIIGATLTPYSGAAYFSVQGEEKRLRVNEWIRTAKDFDGIIDFDAAARAVRATLTRPLNSMPRSTAAITCIRTMRVTVRWQRR